MKALEELRAEIPEYAKDLKLNLQSVLTQSSLDETQRWGVAAATAIATRNAKLREATLADEALLTNKFEAHNRTVSAYFEQRPEDLLVIDWESESLPFSWERLCGFLKVDMPKDTSVPWIRKGGIF